MGIIKQIIVKKLEQSNNLLKKGLRLESYQEHVQAYMISLCYLGLKDNDIKKKNALFKALYGLEGGIFLDKYQKLIQFRKQEDQIIIKALTKMEQQRFENTVVHQLYKPFTWGILGYEYEMYKDE